MDSTPFARRPHVAARSAPSCGSFNPFTPIPMSALLAYFDRRLARLFHLLEKSTLDDRQRLGKRD
jgi:hypothetical protein